MNNQANWDYQKALDRVNHSVYTDDLETTEYIATLQAALEKQIIKEAKMGSSRDTLHRISFCPVCGSLVWKSRYCFNCGQRLRAD